MIIVILLSSIIFSSINSKFFTLYISYLSVLNWVNTEEIKKRHIIAEDLENSLDHTKLIYDL